MGRAPFLIVPAGGTPPAPSLPVTSGLHVWFDALQLDLDNGDAVAQWDDASGNGRHATQGTAAARPTYRQSRLGTYVDFDGVDDLLSTSSWTAISQPNDIFFVARAGNAAVNQYLFDGLGSSNRHLVAAWNGDWWLGAGASLMQGSPDDAPHVFCARYDGASSSLRIDGTAVVSGNAGTHSLTGLTLGSSFAANNFLSGMIAEVVLFSRALSNGERDDVEAYLAEKWGP